MVVKIKLKANSILLHHEDPGVFTKSQWQTSDKNWIFLLYRWILSAFFIYVLSYSLISDPFPINYHFIYLTNIGILLIVIFSTYAALFTTIYHFGIIDAQSNAVFYKLFWLLSNISIILAFMISIVYWATLYDWQSGILTLLDFLTHSSNSTFMLIEIFIVMHPINFLHFIYPIFAGLIYLIFSIIYFYAGGTDAMGNDFIYSILDWNYPGMTSIICVVIAVLILILHCFAVLLQFLRVRLYKLIFDNNVFEITRP